MVAAGGAGRLEQAVAGPVAHRPGLHSQQPRRLARAQERIQWIPIQVVVDLCAHPQDTFTTVASTGWHTGTGPLTETDAWTFTGPTSACTWYAGGGAGVVSLPPLGGGEDGGGLPPDGPGLDGAGATGMGVTTAGELGGGAAAADRPDGAGAGAADCGAG